MLASSGRVSNGLSEDNVCRARADQIVKRHWTLALAYESGFNSKTTFNTAFKNLKAKVQDHILNLWIYYRKQKR
jgi:hypothetical protein